VRFLLPCLVVHALVATACSKKVPAIAELTKTDGPVEKQKTGEDQWGGAAVGTEFFLGDAARTAEGGAQLEVTNGAQIAMQKHTVLRFGARNGESRISVELGAIDLSGTGNYGLDIGDLRLSRNGTVRITAKGNGNSSVQLTFGEAQVSTVGGGTQDLVIGKEIDIMIGAVVATPMIDAGVEIDAVVADAAGSDVVAGEPTIDVTGKRAEIQLVGETRWKPLAAGAGTVPKGAKVRIGGNTTAKLVARGTTLELTGGSRVAVTEVYGFTIEMGGARAAMTAEDSVSLPGGAIAMKGTDAVPSEAKLDAGGGGTKVTVQRGGAKLTGTGGSELEMNRGESATLLKSGQIRPLEAIPTYFDLRITPGESFTIHDPRPPTAVQFQFAGKCPQGGIVELDRDARFRTAKVSGGKEAANHLVKGGRWHYRLRCTSGAGEGAAVASGVVSVIHDGGTRSLPPKPGVNPFELDGRPWAFSYQSAIPDLAVKFPGTAASFKLHLARGGKDLTFESATNKLRVPGAALSEGVYTYWFDRDGVKQDKVNTLKIDFDQTAPQVYIELPVNGKPWAADIDVRGAVLPGWSAAVEGVAVPIDAQRRFTAKVGAPPGRALAIKLSHPLRGMHYYLRRGN